MTARVPHAGLFDNVELPERGLRNGRCRADHRLSRTRITRKPRLTEAPLRKLHRRPLDRPGRRRLQSQSEPRHGTAVLRGRALDRAGHRLRARRRARRARGVGRDLDDRPRQGPQRDRRRDRGEPRDARGRRELGERQAGSRDPRCRPSAGDRPFPLLRRCDPRRGGPDLRDRQGYGRVSLQRAARRRRADRPVQLPAADGGVEAGARDRGRQLCRDQAREPDAVVAAEAHGGASETSSRPASSTSSPDPARPSGWRLPRASGSRRSRSPARP